MFQKTLKITDAPVMAMGAAAAPAPVQEEEVEVKQEKTLFTVKLTKFDAAKKIAVIKEIKSLIAGMNLVQVSQHGQYVLKNPKKSRNLNIII